jgi:ribosomal protein S18 acetylase RimI-like enzyme
MALVIRKATMDDLDAVLAVGHRTWPATYEGIAGADYVQAGLAKWWSAEATSPAIRQGRLTVAQLDGEVVGMASVGREEDHLVLWRLYVLPEHHGQGIGSALLRTVLEEADGRYAEIRLSYTEGNTPAAHFYRSRGFVETHHEAGGGGVPDQVWMSRRVPQGDGGGAGSGEADKAATSADNVTAASRPASTPADTEGEQS